MKKKLSDLEKRRRPGNHGVEREVTPLPDGGGLIRIALDRGEREFLEKTAEQVGFRGHTRAARLAKDIFLDTIDSGKVQLGYPLVHPLTDELLDSWIVIREPGSSITDKLRDREVQYTLNSAELSMLRRFAEVAKVPEAEYARACILQLKHAMEKKDRRGGSPSPTTQGSDTPQSAPPPGTGGKGSRGRRSR